MHFVADRAIAGPGLPPNGRIAACGEVRNAGFAPPLSGCQPRGKAKFGMNEHAGTKYVLGIPLLAACVGFIGFIQVFCKQIQKVPAKRLFYYSLYET